MSEGLRALAAGAPDAEAAPGMLLGSYFAGMALQAGPGLAHVLAQPITAVTGIPHSAAIAALLPRTVGFNQERRPGDEAYPVLAALLEPSGTATSQGPSAACSTRWAPESICRVWGRSPSTSPPSCRPCWVHGTHRGQPGTPRHGDGGGGPGRGPGRAAGPAEAVPGKGPATWPASTDQWWLHSSQMYSLRRTVYLRRVNRRQTR